MSGLRDLKRRIKSIQSTRKITKAMQMVSAAKMRKAQEAVVKSRSYAALAWELIESLGDVSAWPGSEHEASEAVKPGAEHFTETSGFKTAQKIGIILLATNRGLVGSLNTNLLPKLREVAAAQGQNEVIAELITYGKKSHIIAARLQKNISADFPKLDRSLTTRDIYPIARYVLDAFATGKYRKIHIVYNHFVSTLTQKPTAKQLLPLGNTGKSKNAAAIPDLPANNSELSILFEPDPKTVIDRLIPRIIESQIYQSVLESDASEHSARMVMMKNATEAAGDLISDYTLTYNQLRQNKITTELAEITAGKIALE